MCLSKRVRSGNKDDAATAEPHMRGRLSKSMDLISELPDEILVSVLSLLTLKEAAMTSVLSKRWKLLWLFTMRLNFDDDAAVQRISNKSIHLDEEIHGYINWVNTVLRKHMGSTINEFRIYFDLNKCFASDIDRWVQFALGKKVQNLELHLFVGASKFRPDSILTYNFPLQLSNVTEEGSSLKNLAWNPRNTHPPMFTGFQSLKALQLKCVNVTGEVLECFLSSCPLLERLVVHGSRKLVSLRVCGSSLSLKHLEVHSCFCVEMIEICNTNLVSLSYSGSDKINLQLKDVPLLVEVFYFESSKSSLDSIFSKFSCCLSQLEVLTLNLFWRKRLSSFPFPKLANLKQLELMAAGYLGTDYVLGITYLIKACPFLERFVYKMILCGSSMFKSKKSTARFYHEHLKVVELGGYDAEAGCFKLAMYFIKYAVGLEKMILNPRPCSQYRQKINIERVENTRQLARKQFRGKVPPSIDFVIL